MNAAARAIMLLAVVGAGAAVVAAPRFEAAPSWSIRLASTRAHASPATVVVVPVTRTMSTATQLRAPHLNLPPSPDYRDACWGGGAVSAQRSTACRRRVLAAINHAHSVEHVRPIRLPRGFWSLGVRRQIFVITNAERVTRGLPPVQGLARQANRWAALGAQHNADPYAHASRLASGAQVRAWGSNWAADYNALTADYSWMYMDGWGGSRASTSNIDCTSRRAAGCWGHRDNILARFGGSHSIIGGVGFVRRGWAGYFTSYAQLFVRYSGRRPAFTYTWRQATRAGAR
jgi:hypothetical protein